MLLTVDEMSAGGSTGICCESLRVQYDCANEVPEDEEEWEEVFCEFSLLLLCVV